MKVGDLVLDSIDGNFGIIIEHKPSISTGYCWEVFDLIGMFVWNAHSNELEVISESRRSHSMAKLAVSFY